jgi:hypothetical protein
MFFAFRYERACHTRGHVCKRHDAMDIRVMTAKATLDCYRRT